MIDMANLSGAEEVSWASLLSLEQPSEAMPRTTTSSLFAFLFSTDCLDRTNMKRTLSVASLSGEEDQPEPSYKRARIPLASAPGKDVAEVTTAAEQENVPPSSSTNLLKRTSSVAATLAGMEHQPASSHFSAPKIPLTELSLRRTGEPKWEKRFRILYQENPEPGILPDEDNKEEKPLPRREPVFVSCSTEKEDFTYYHVNMKKKIIPLSEWKDIMRVRQEGIDGLKKTKRTMSQIFLITETYYPRGPETFESFSYQPSFEDSSHEEEYSYSAIFRPFE
jgi:hypothetical protein